MTKSICTTFDQATSEFKKTSSQFADCDARTIDEAILPVMSHHDKRSIGLLLLSLDDAAQDDAGMFSLIHAAESFDDDTYVNEFLSVLPQLLTKSPKWTSIVLMRCLNSEMTKEAMVRKVREADPEVKSSIIWLCEKINQRSPSFLSKTLPLLLAAK
jgi:hypothetical protein